MNNESMMFFDDRSDFESFISYHVKKGLADIDVAYSETEHKKIISEQCNTYTYVMFSVRGLNRNDLVGLVTSAIYRCRSSSGDDSVRFMSFGAEGLPLPTK